MRILRLNLAAVGPFTDRMLSFDTQEPGLHLVFGPNEAGKSSALRALHALLFGFPERCGDNCFKHDYPQLRVGGTLAHGDRQLTFFRRKRRPPADLLDADGNPLAAAALASFLAGLDEQLFSSLCGLNHETLVRGGEDILAQHGEVGHALFAAGTGVIALQEILAKIEAESNELFKPRGSKQAINEAVDRYKTASRAIKEASLAGREWKEHRDRLNASLERLEMLNDLRRERDRRRQVLLRLRQTLPLLARRREAIAEIEAFGAPPVLPTDFGVRRKEAEEGLLSSQAQFVSMEKRLADLRMRRGAIFFRQEVLAQAAALERLQQGVGTYNKAMKDKPTIVELKNADQSAAEQALAMVKPGMSLDEAGNLRPILTRRGQIEKLTLQREKLQVEVAQAEMEQRRLSRELDKTQRRLDELPQSTISTELEAVVRLARKAGDIDGLLSEKQQTLKGFENTAMCDLQRLGHWGGGLHDLVNARLPLPERMEWFGQRLQEMEEESRHLAKERRDLTSERQKIETEQHKLQYAGTVVSETDLFAAREKRDLQWGDIRRAWLLGDLSDAGLGKAEMADTYEIRMTEADTVADRLRREAERVQRFASLRAGMENVDATLARLAREEEELEQRRQTLLTEWQGLWSEPVSDPGLPREMQAWLHRFEALREKLVGLGKLHDEVAALAERRSNLSSRLLEQLVAVGETALVGEELAAPLALAETVLERERNTRQEREKLAGKIHELNNSLENARETASRVEADLTRWAEEWSCAVAGLGGTDTAAVAPENAGALLDALREALDGIKKVETHGKRITAIDRDCQEFETAVAAICQEIAPELSAHSPTDAVQKLQSLLVETRKSADLAKSMSEEMLDVESQVFDAQKALTDYTARQQELMRLAGCADVQELTKAEERFMAYQSLRRKLAELDEHLANAGGGMSIAELDAEASGVDADALPGEIEAISDEIDNGIVPELAQLQERIGGEKKELARMDGSSRAADAAGEMEAALARIRRLANDYVRVRLAGHVLQDAMERFRAENQDPVLSLASAHFSRLTLGGFNALKTDVNDSGQPILVAIRKEGTPIGVEAMSSGTRDQLFLALRLAALDWRQKQGEPLPLILDDILINFDDVRSSATLELLAELGCRFQVILFTHHERVLADANGLSGPVAVHQLG